MKPQTFQLRTKRIGPLPLVKHYLDRLGVAGLLERPVPTPDRRTGRPKAVGLGIVLRSILTEREPLYRLGEVVETFAPEGFGLTEEQAGELSDDADGRGLDRPIGGDRGGLLTAIVPAAVEGLARSLGELHNDTTTARFTSQFRGARGHSLGGKKAPFITDGDRCKVILW